MEHVQFLDLTSTACGLPNADVRTLLVTSGHHSCAMSVASSDRPGEFGGVRSAPALHIGAVFVYERYVCRTVSVQALRRTMACHYSLGKLESDA